jgi:hypothetical protein
MSATRVVVAVRDVIKRVAWLDNSSLIVSNVARFSAALDRPSGGRFSCAGPGIFPRWSSRDASACLNRPAGGALIATDLGRSLGGRGC